MIAVANIAALILLSLFGGKDSSPDPHGLHDLSRDPVVRRMLLEGRFDEYSAVVDGFMGRRLSYDLSRNSPVSPRTVQSTIAGRADLSALLDAVKKAVAVASFAAELKALGPVKGLLEAVRWVDTGLIRRSGLRPKEFPSYFGIVRERDSRKLSQGDMEALGEDLVAAQARMDSSYASLVGRIAESFY